MLNLEWLDTEQNFLHQRVLMDAKKLNKEQLLEIFVATHKQQLIHKRLFSSLISWCARSGVILPPLTELLSPRQIKHPLLKDKPKCASNLSDE
jgi:hypothetical protein